MENLADYLVYFLLLGFLAWFLVPSVLDLLGYNWKKDMDVFESYCNLKLRRRYDK